MGRSPDGLKKKRPWTPEEDQKLIAYIQLHGRRGPWNSVPAKAGLQRSGMSCRVRWVNYVRPDIKRGVFTEEEEKTIIDLHAQHGNRWSLIAKHLQNRTENDVMNYWKKLHRRDLTQAAKIGTNRPVTHKSRGGTGSASSAHTALVLLEEPEDDENFWHNFMWQI